MIATIQLFKKRWYRSGFRKRCTPIIRCLPSEIGCYSVCLFAKIGQFQAFAQGGDIIEADLLQYEEVKGGETPFMLLGEFDGNQYFSQSGLIGLNGPETTLKGRPVYKTTQKAFTLTGDELRVPLEFTDSKGVTFTKTYIFKKGDYAVDLIKPTALIHQRR